MFSVRRRAAAAPGASLVAARAALPSVSGSLATPAAAATRVAAVTAATAVTRSLSSAVTRAVNARRAVAASGPTSSIAAIARNARIANRVLAPGAACTAGGLTFSPRFYAAADYPDHFVVRFPALSPTMTDGNMKEWTVSVGEEVTNGDVVCSIETDKAVLEFESPEDGFVAKILVDEGSTGVQVGEPMLIIAEAEEDVGAFDGFTAADAGEGGDAPEPAAEEPAAPAAAAPAAADAAPADAPSSGAAAPAASGERVFASPLARKTAGEKGVNIGGVSPTGPNNRVVAADVLEAAASGSAAPAASVVAAAMGGAAGGDWEDIPLTNMRRVIAQRLTESKQTVPHFYVTVECEIDSLMAVRKQLNDEADGNYKLSVNDFVVKASALALREVPEVNSAWMGDFIRKHNTVDISIAVDTGDGLITPIVTDADSRGLSSISSTVKDLAGRARDNKLLPQEYQGGTFSISNLGMFGVKHFTAIINPPQACILAVGSAEKRLVPDATAESGHSTANVMAVTLSCDHRVVDGARGAKWLQAFKRHIENPLTMLL